MSRQSLFAVNATMAILLAVQAITGIRLWFVNLIGWEDSETWMNAHLITGFGLLVLIAIHLYMNREWIKAQFSGLSG
jgi:cytochrome b subunit of formate dehydrogenase